MALGRGCFSQAFSGCGERGLLSRCGARTLGHAGFSTRGSRALEHRLSSSSTRASLLCRTWGHDQVRSLPVSVGPRVDASPELGLCLLLGSCSVWTRVISRSAGLDLSQGVEGVWGPPGRDRFWRREASHAHVGPGRHVQGPGGGWAFSFEFCLWSTFNRWVPARVLRREGECGGRSVCRIGGVTSWRSGCSAHKSSCRGDSRTQLGPG